MSQQSFAVQGKHIRGPRGLGAENPAKMKKVIEKGLSVAETVKLSGTSFSIVEHYRKHFQAALT